MHTLTGSCGKWSNTLDNHKFKGFIWTFQFLWITPKIQIFVGLYTGQSDSGWGSTRDLTRSHWVLEYVTCNRLTILGSLTAVCLQVYGQVQSDWQLASNLQPHIKMKNPKHSTTHNIKSHHSHLTIPKGTHTARGMNLVFSF